MTGWLTDGMAPAPDTAGAIEMANTELKNGQFGDAMVLAQRIVTSQTAEVTKMAVIAKRLG